MLPRVYSLLLVAIAIALSPLATVSGAGVETLAEKIALTPQSGTAPEDLEIQRWQTRAREANPRSDSFERLAWAYVAKARRTLDVGYYKLAEQTADAMDARFGPSPESRLVRGHVMHNLHRFREAEGIARQLVKERGLPNDFGLLSDALMEQGKLNEAVEALQQMVNLKPGAEAYGRIAHVRWLKGDLRGAIEAMSQAERAGSPRDAEAYAWIVSRLSGYYLQGGQFAQALALSETANKTAPEYPPALLARGKALLVSHQANEAVAVLEEATRLNPLPEYQWWLADALRAKGAESAAVQVESELKTRGEVSDPRTLALFLATRNESAALAVKLAREELENRGDVLTQDALAWALFRSGDFDGANRAMQMALAESTQDARLFLHAGAIAQQRGDKAAAESFFQRAKSFSGSLTPSERTLLNNWLTPAGE